MRYAKAFSVRQFELVFFPFLHYLCNGLSGAMITLHFPINTRGTLNSTFHNFWIGGTSYILFNGPWLSSYRRPLIFNMFVWTRPKGTSLCDTHYIYCKLFVLVLLFSSWVKDSERMTPFVILYELASYFHRNCWWFCNTTFWLPCRWNYSNSFI